MFTPKRILILGLWLIVISLLGVPHSWKITLVVLTGLYLCAAALFALKNEYLALHGVYTRESSTAHQAPPEKADTHSIPK